MLLAFTFYAALIGLFAVVYKHILAYEEILNWWFRFGSRFEGRWFWKPIWGCELCISGQIALWSYVGNWICHSYFDRMPYLTSFIWKVIPMYQPHSYNVLEGVIFICQSIAAAWLIFKGFDKLRGE
jgi:hypothetical protein